MKQGLYEIKQWIITKIILFLMDGEIVKKFLNKLGEKNDDIESNTKLENKNKRTIESRYTEICERLHKIERLYKVAIDANPPEYGESWAVICIKGNPEYVRFVKFKRNDIREIQRFLSQFEAKSQHIRDVPHGIPKDLFLDL